MTAMSTVQQLDTRLHEQILDVAHLRAALAVQTTRISQMYDTEGSAARIDNYTIATAATGIRGRSTVKTHPVPGTFRP